jgi:hypothetical protein
MLSKLYFAFCGIALFVSHSLAAADNDSCLPLDPLDHRVNLLLRSARIEHVENAGVFYGVFEFENQGLATSVSIPGTKEGKTFLVGRPELTVEFKDLRSRWVSLPEAPAIFLLKPDKLIVPPNTNGVFTALLMSQEIANLSASEFRIVLHLSDPLICIVSRSFRAIPVRKPVEGFETNPAPSRK